MNVERFVTDSELPTYSFLDSTVNCTGNANDFEISPIEILFSLSVVLLYRCAKGIIYLQALLNVIDKKRNPSPGCLSLRTVLYLRVHGSLLRPKRINHAIHAQPLLRNRLFRPTALPPVGNLLELSRPRVRHLAPHRLLSPGIPRLISRPENRCLRSASLGTSPLSLRI